MRRWSRLLVVPLVMVGLALPGPPPASAAVERLVVKTVRIGDKPVRFVFAVDGVRAFVQMKFRRDGRWRTVASDRTECNYRAGSHSPSLEVQKADRQVLVSWTYPSGGVIAEYGGFNVRHRTLDMFGTHGCAAAG